jgi:cellulose synthase/poly-beta-1,6-N-acetylglucosamine synthase-like glycosyltransferase
MKGISLIVPVWNEQDNIRFLVKKIALVFREIDQQYEVIFVDDRSTDKTVEVIKSLNKKYPVRVFGKKGKPGKAFSLLEGFSYAKYDLLCMIDADLQYSPEYIPQMIEKIERGADIVVGERRQYDASLIRKIVTKTYRLFFGRLLHGFDLDVQSGLKVFKGKIIDHVRLHPSSWTFDLDFLLQARHAGYRIESISIVFHKRHAGRSKIALLRSSLEIGFYALWMKFADSRLVHFPKNIQKSKGEGFHSRGMEFVRYTDLEIAESAFSRMTFSQSVILFLLVLAGLSGLIYNWHGALVVFISFLTLVYFTDLLFNFFLIYRSYFREPDVKIKPKELASIGESEWPVYTILCPLYKELAVLPQFIRAMSDLSYPKDKLQVLLLLEADDRESIKKVKAMDLPSYFQIAVVPDSSPKTKPKALNYGLSKTRGEYVVIYDAEDIPDPLQLKKAVLAFRKATKQIICIQAKLNFYNPGQNVLTRLFTIEYSLWFNLVLTGLQSIHAPIPLGGTSNHFRTADIVRLKKWDPFNVTEDADLGMRLIKRGYRTALLDSYTLEEANSDVFNWFRQRSRWIKGYIQTYFVHMRTPSHFFAERNKPHFWIFQLVIGAKILSLLINPLMWLMTITYFVFYQSTADFIQSLYLTPIFYMAIFCITVGNFLYMYYYMLGAAKRDQWQLIPFALVTPVYWLGMSMAAVFALWEFVFKPFYWHKTRHGLHLNSKKNDILLSAFSKDGPRIAVSPVLE